MKRRKPKRSTTARCYGVVHQTRWKQLKALVAAGQAVCARCGNPISPIEPWDLDHTDDRTGYLGPSHRRCNRATSKPRPQTRQW